MNMIETIRRGAFQPIGLTQNTPKRCPFCGEDAPLAAKVGTRYVVACMSDYCDASVQTSGFTPEEAMAKWNRRY